MPENIIYPHKPVNTAELLPAGPIRFLYRPFQPIVEKIAGFTALNALYRSGKQGTAEEFASSLLHNLKVESTLPPADQLQALQQIKGPLFIGANHPTGGTDAFAFIQLLETLRPGKWKLLANQVLAKMPQLAPHIFPVNVMNPGTPENQRQLKSAIKFLRSGGLLAAFPAGRVSDLDPETNTPLDSEWSDQLPRISKIAKAHTALIHIQGRNSQKFYDIPKSKSLKRTISLASELTNPTSKQINLTLKAIIPPTEQQTAQQWHKTTHTLSSTHPS